MIDFQYSVQLKSLREPLVAHLALMPVLKRPAAGGTPTRPLLKRPAAAGLQREQAVSSSLLPPSLLPPLVAKEAEVPEWYGVADVEAEKQVFFVTAAKLVIEVDKVDMDGERKPPPLKDPATIA